MLRLNNIPASTSGSRKRVGRGKSSRWGKTAGKGTKGQSSRGGRKPVPGFEGGQTPLYRRLPKRGFKNFHKRPQVAFNIRDLEYFGLDEISIQSLVEAKKIRKGTDRLAIIGVGEPKKPYRIKAHRVSAKAREKIEKAGGSVEILGVPGSSTKDKPST